jgi:hypothetical protein
MHGTGHAMQITTNRTNSAEDIAAEAFAAVKEIIRRAIITLWTLKDPDRKYLTARSSSWLLSVVRERSESPTAGPHMGSNRPRTTSRRWKSWPDLARMAAPHRG